MAQASMPQLDIATYPEQVVWLLVSFGILYVVLARWGLPRVQRGLEARRRRLDELIQKAERLQQTADALLEKHHAVLRAAHRQVHERTESAQHDRLAMLQKRHDAFHRSLQKRLLADRESAKVCQSALMDATPGVAAILAQGLWKIFHRSE